VGQRKLASRNNKLVEPSRRRSGATSKSRITDLAGCPSSRGGVTELFNIPLFNLVQRRFAAEEIGVQLRHQLAWHYIELVVRDLSPGNRAACRDQMRSPLKDQTQVPHDEQAHGKRKANRSRGAAAK